MHIYIYIYPRHFDQLVPNVCLSSFVISILMLLCYQSFVSLTIIITQTIAIKKKTTKCVQQIQDLSMHGSTQLYRIVFLFARWNQIKVDSESIGALEKNILQSTIHSLSSSLYIKKLSAERKRVLRRKIIFSVETIA